MFKKLFLFLFIFSLVSLSFITLSCDKKVEDTVVPTDSDETQNEVVSEPVQAMSIYHSNLYFRKEPEYGSNTTGTIAKGEPITFLGRIEEGPGYNGAIWEYYFVKRLDGTEGWAWGNYIVPDCTPAVTAKKTTTYNQPSDGQVNMDFSFEPMSILAIIEDNGAWLKVLYESKDKAYWIKPGTLSYAELDIGLANKINIALSGDDKIAELEKLLEIDAFRDSVFTNNIHEKLFELQDTEPLEDMQDQGAEPQDGTDTSSDEKTK